MSEQWKVGDKVRLTGRLWGVTDTPRYRVGDEHEVAGVRADGWVQFKDCGFHWSITAGWEIELVERAEEKKMSVDISEVNVGDKVKLTRANGDEATFTVKRRVGDYLDADLNYYAKEEGDTLEILEKKFELIPGLYSNEEGHRTVVTKDGQTYFTAVDGGWIKADIYPGDVSYNAAREHGTWKREITF